MPNSIPHRNIVLILLMVMMIATFTVGAGAYLVLQRQGDQADSLKATVAELKGVEQHQTAETDCQAAYNQQMAVALAARFDSGAAIQVTLHSFLLSLVPALQHPASPAEVTAIRNRLNSYLLKYAHYQQARESHPLPPLPNKFCSAANTRGGNR